MIEEREKQKLLCVKDANTEVRAFLNVDGDLFIVWWDRRVDGSWVPDRGGWTMLPKEGVGNLAALIADERP